MLLVVGEALVIRTRGAAVVHPSGAPAIAAWVATQLGTPTAFVGAVGDDADGRLLIDRLGAAGQFATKPELRTARAEVEYLPDGSRRFDFAVEHSAATALEPADLHDLPERAEWVHVSGSALLFGGPLADTAVAAVERGRAAGATISIDPNLRPELPGNRARLRTLCIGADALFPSDFELVDLGLDEDDQLARGTVVCRTLAAEGAVLRVGDDTVRIPAVAAADDVVDPDGAGDTFAGALVAARLRGLPWSQAAHAAARIVARAIAVDGPMTVALSPHDVGD